MVLRDMLEFAMFICFMEIFGILHMNSIFAFFLLYFYTFGCSFHNLISWDFEDIASRLHFFST